MTEAVYSINQLTDAESKILMNELKFLDKNIELKVNKVISTTGCKHNEALEYVVVDNPILWAKVYLNWTCRDYQIPIISEGKKSRQLVLRLGRRLGKCLPGNVLIPDSVTGEYKTVAELYEKQKANIFSLNEANNNITCNDTNIIFENGVKPVYRITTKNGRKIEATGNHPMYTINGWVEVDDLKIGDYIGVATDMWHNTPTCMDDNEIKFLAYIIGDGNCKGNKLRFSCNKENLKVLCEMDIISKYYNCELKQYESDKSCDYHIVSSNKNSKIKNHNEAKQFIKNMGLWDKGSHDKFIPDEIFKLNKDQLKIFISRLYATDGWACVRNNKNHKNSFEIGYCTVSEKLATQLQSLLLRYNVNSTIRTKKVKYNGGINIAYSLEILNIVDVINFCENIGIYSKEHCVYDVMKVAGNTINYGRKIPSDVNKYILEYAKKNDLSTSDIRKCTEYRFDRKYKTVMSTKVKKVCEYIGDKELEKYYNNNIVWDEIIKIEFIGDMPTYDLTVPNHHNFVANDFITHNTDSMCVLILWYAYTQHNKGPNNQYNILILTPYETQIDLIFDRLKQLIESSPLMQGMLTREIHHRKELSNGSIITGLTAGASSGNSGSNNSRGQRADIIVLDECDYIGSSQITNIINIRNEAPERIKVIAASTPSGKHEEYYKWCTGASKRYYPKKEDIDNFKFTEYLIDDNGKEGNGWTEIYAPSIVNKELLKVNPDTEQTYLQDIKDELSELRYDQEVMAEFGDEELGVYQKKYIQKAIEEGNRIGHKYTIDMSEVEFNNWMLRRHEKILCLGVDWDKVQSGTTFVATEFDKSYIGKNGNVEPKFKVLFRIEIPRSEFTYVNAINKIVELNEIYDFDWIAVDKGYGETQIELLHKYGIENPESGLREKVIGYQFGQKLDVRDPHTMIKDKKPLKPFMVNNSVIVFEKEKIVFNPSDKLIVEQFESYKIKAISSTGIPTYIDENEHAVDALNLCLLIFEQKYGSLFKNIMSSKILALNEFRRNEIEISRDIVANEQKSSSLIISINKNNRNSFNRDSTFDNYSSQRNGYRRASGGSGQFARSRF